MPWKEKLILALDLSHSRSALEIVDRLGDNVNIYKIGLELFTSEGPKIISELHKRKKKVFLDLKFHDIPNTVKKAAIAATRMGIFMFNIHASGGFEMMKTCSESVKELCYKENLFVPKIIGVTVLTSLSNDVLKNELCIHHGVKSHVKHLSALAKRAGLDGVVASVSEISIIKEHCGRDFLVVTPGIRPSWSPPDDQRRTATPKEALKEGADFIVIGRAILRQDDPIRALELISLEILTV
jgi:orotidine-5'-phosphate decarboxylase